LTGSATIVLAVLTGIYVCHTGRMLQEMKLAREPNVYFDIELPDNDLRASISNHGYLAAANITFTFEESLPWGQKRDKLADHDVFKNGISYLSPGRVLKYRLGRLNWNDLNKENAKLSVRITFTNEVGKTFKRNYLFDISHFKSVLFSSFQGPEERIVKALILEKQMESGKLATLMRSRDKKRCPFCAELISVNAKKCAHCHEFLKDDNT
jgi:hypothetical protein